MATFFVSYDLTQGSEQDYADLWDSLKRRGAVRVMESLWCLKSNATAEALRDIFKMHIHEDDRLIVIQEEDWSSNNLMSSPNKL